MQGASPRTTSAATPCNAEGGTLACDLTFRSFEDKWGGDMGAAAAPASCKADWSKARANYGNRVRDEFLFDLITATNKFLSGPQAREAFRGDWTKEDLFGVTLEQPHQFGLVCAVVNASLAIVCFDGGWVFIKTPAIPGEDGTDTVLRYFRSAFRHRGSVPWWRHPTYSRIG